MRPADAEEHVAQRGRVGRVAAGGAGGRAVDTLSADRHQRRRVDGAGVDGDPGDDHTLDAPDTERNRTVHRGQRRHAQTENDGVRTGDGDRLSRVIDHPG